MHPDMLTGLIAHLAQEGLLAVDPDQMGRAAAAPRGESRGGAVALIPLTGVLMPKGGRSMWGSWKGMDDFRAAIGAAARSPDVAAIVIDVDSPGGTVAGTIETAAAVRAAAEAKPVVAVANGLAASAAYWIASQASEVVAVPSGDVGSIGVIGVHQSVGRLYERMGVDTTLISAGKYKTEGNPFEPLGEEAKAAIQARVDEAYDRFVAEVASGRKRSAKAVREGFGEGRVVGAAAALAEGMIDRIASLDEVVAGLAAGKGKVWRRRSALAFT